MTRPLLLAGTRVTGPVPHLGTFYGWLRPLARAAEDMAVCVLVADLQSLDANDHRSLGADTERLIETLTRYLPRSVPVIRESDVPSLPLLALCASTLLAGHHLRRVGPLRKLAATGHPTTLPTLLYPAMMMANVLAFDATHVLAKPEGRFQHHDVLNDALRRGPNRFGWPALRLTPHPKPRIDLPNGDGSGPMKRGTPGALGLDRTDPATVRAWACRLPAPEHAQPPVRASACRVVLSIWRAVTHDQPQRYERIEQRCTSGALDCGTCRTALADAIAADLAPSRPPVHPPPPSFHAAQAEQRARTLIALATGKPCPLS